MGLPANCRRLLAFFCQAVILFSDGRTSLAVAWGGGRPLDVLVAGHN